MAVPHPRELDAKAAKAWLDPALRALAAFVGAGPVLAGATGWCGMATLFAKLPDNRRAVA